MHASLPDDAPSPKAFAGMHGGVYRYWKVNERRRTPKEVGMPAGANVQTDKEEACTGEGALATQSESIPASVEVPAPTPAHAPVPAHAHARAPTIF